MENRRICSVNGYGGQIIANDPKFLFSIVFHRKICYSTHTALICKIGGHAFRTSRCFNYME